MAKNSEDRKSRKSTVRGNDSLRVGRSTELESTLREDPYERGVKDAHESFEKFRDKVREAIRNK